MPRKQKSLWLIALLPLAVAGCGGEASTHPTADRSEGSSVLAAGASSSESGITDMKSEKSDSEMIQKTDAEWKSELTAEQYRVLREKGTERAFSGEYWDEKAEGVYVCAACGQPLYSSETKFDSGTGWPSFWQAVEEGAVATRPDRSWFTTRTEAVCSRCGGHLGHIFEDGPEPTGLRHCINSASLELIEAEENGDPQPQ